MNCTQSSFDFDGFRVWIFFAMWFSPSTPPPPPPTRARRVSFIRMNEWWRNPEFFREFIRRCERFINGCLLLLLTGVIRVDLKSRESAYYSFFFGFIRFPEKKRFEKTKNSFVLLLRNYEKKHSISSDIPESTFFLSFLFLEDKQVVAFPELNWRKLQPKKRLLFLFKFYEHFKREASRNRSFLTLKVITY